jgi:hypothetical protein
MTQVSEILRRVDWYWLVFKWELAVSTYSVVEKYIEYETPTFYLVSCHRKLEYLNIWSLHFSKMLRSVDWYLVTDVSEQSIGPILNGPAELSYSILHTPWSRVLLEKRTGLQLVKKLPTFYGTRMFITAFTSPSHLSLSIASSIKSIPHLPLLEDPS